MRKVEQIDGCPQLFEDFLEFTELAAGHAVEYERATVNLDKSLLKNVKLLMWTQLGPR